MTVVPAKPTRLAVVTWTSPPLFGFRASRRDLVSRFGPPDAADQDSNGWGSFDEWLLKFDCGLEIAIWQFERDGLGAAFSDEDPQRTNQVLANDRELHHLAFHVGLDLDAIEGWVPDPTHVGTRRWVVSRRDQRERVTVGSFTSRCEADYVARGLVDGEHVEGCRVEET